MSVYDYNLIESAHWKQQPYAQSNESDQPGHAHGVISGIALRSMV